MTAGALKDTFSPKSRLGVIFLLVLASLALPHIPFLNLLGMPIQSFTTLIHELGHAISCLLTGGQVSGISIINDGDGHGGLTFCRGGIPFIYAQAGYIATALAGCGMIWIGHYPKLSRPVLMTMGVGFGVVSITFLASTILQGQIVAGLGSMAVGIAMGVALFFIGWKSNFYCANLVLLFLGIQTGLNALNDDAILVMQAVGAYGPGTWSDATNMQNMTMIPAPIWAATWTVISVGLMYLTLRACYKQDKKTTAINTI
jgi:hypothetical protein